MKKVYAIFLDENNLENILDNLRNLSPEVTEVCVTLSVELSDLFFSSVCLRASGSQLNLLFKELPTTVTEVNLSSNFLGSWPEFDLKKALQGLPPTVSSVNLAGNNLGKRTGLELKNALQGLSQGVVKVHLGSNDFEESARGVLQEALEGLPGSVTEVNLSGNYLSVYGKSLKEVFLGLSANVSYLDLSHSRLCACPKDDLRTAFKGLPPNLTKLGLGANFRVSNHESNLTELLQILPSSINHIDLSVSHLGDMDVINLIGAFQRLPANITSIDLSNNRLNIEQLEAILRIIPSTVTYMNVDSNYLFVDHTMRQTEEAIAKIHAVKNPAMLLSMKYNGYSLVSRTLPFFLAGSCGFFKRQPLCTLKNLPTKLISHIFSFLYKEEDYAKRMAEYKKKHRAITAEVSRRYQP